MMAKQEDPIASQDYETNNHGHHPVLTTFARELTERLIREDNTITINEIQEAVEDRRKRLTHNDLKNLELRAERLRHLLSWESEERAFWIYYHDRLHEAKPTDANGTNDSTIQFFYKVLEQWRRGNDNDDRDVENCRQKAASHWQKKAAPWMHEGLLLPQSGDENARGRADGSDLVAHEAPEALRAQDLNDIELEALENCVTEEVETLNELRAVFPLAHAPEYTEWTQSIDLVIAQKNFQGHKIAIVGITGAGKSSVINALLGETLLPTSSVRACTSFSTEVAYRDIDQSSYGSITIDFVDEAFWRTELEMFFAALPKDVENDELREEDEELEVMRSKIKAVYPQFSEEELCGTDTKKLLQAECIVGKLGKTNTIAATSAGEIYDTISRLIDGSSDEDAESNMNEQPTLWPLVKSVKIEVQNDFLRNGVTLVDLPGVQDSNRARSAIAENKMLECSAIWLVAPIIRASDESAACDMLIKAFHAKFHLDGLSLGFVCTKIDDIGLPEEEGRKLRIQRVISSLQKEQQRVRQQINALQGRGNGRSQAQVVHSMARPDKRSQSQRPNQALSNKFAPQTEPSSLYAGRKRKRDEPKVPIWQKLLPWHTDVSTETNSEIANEDEIDVEVTESENEPSVKKRNRKGPEDQSSVHRERDKLREEEIRIQHKMWQACIHARNNIARKAIKKSISQCLERYQRTEQSSAGNPNASDSDNAEVLPVKEMPIVMVSSRAYAKLLREQNQQWETEIGRDALSSFSTYEQTGIPELAEQAIEQATRKRRAHALNILNKCWLTRNALQLWASDKFFNDDVTEVLLTSERNKVDMRLVGMSNALEKSLSACHKRMTEGLQKNLVCKFDSACVTAQSRATTESLRFTNSIRAWTTYRAMVRRNGQFTSGNGDYYDLNNDLCEPLMNQIGVGWKRTFGTLLLQCIDQTDLGSISPMENLHNFVRRQAVAIGASSKLIKILDDQCRRYSNEISDAYRRYQQEIEFKQRRTRQVFKHTIQERLEDTYSKAESMRGRGAFQAMKASVRYGVEVNRSSMFVDAAEQVQSELEQTLTDANRQLRTRILDEILPNIKRDYANVFHRPTTSEDRPKTEIQSRVLAILKDAAEQMSRKQLTISVPSPAVNRVVDSAG